MESVQCLGRLVQCVDSNKNKAVGKMIEFVGVRKSVVGLTNELILRGALEQSNLEVNVACIYLCCAFSAECCAIGSEYAAIVGEDIVQFMLSVMKLVLASYTLH